MPFEIASISVALPTTPSPAKQRRITVVPSLFSVVSWGCAGTAWLARALNAHPDIFCVHGANHYLQSMCGAPPLDGLDYMHVIAALATGHEAVGDVHGISRHLIPELRENYGPVFSSAVLVRDPLPRVKSQLALFKSMPAAANWDLSYTEAFADQLELKPAQLTQNDRLRLHAFNMLNAIAEETEVGPIFRIEDLVRRQDSVAALLSHLSSGRLNSPGWWLDYVTRIPAFNGHQSAGNPTELSSADLRLLSRIVTDESKELYRQLGYFVAA